MRIFMRLLALVLLLLLFVFCVNNQQSVSVALLGYSSPELPLFLVLIFSFFGGFVMALLWQAVRGSGPRREPLPERQSKAVDREPEPNRPKEKKKRSWRRKRAAAEPETSDTDTTPGREGSPGGAAAEATGDDAANVPEPDNKQ